MKDIEWRVYPPDLLGVALQKGEIQAFSSNDPIASIIRDRDHLVEVTNNLSDEFATAPAACWASAAAWSATSVQLPPPSPPR